MSTVKVSDIAAHTGLSARYWQRRIAAGHVPGCRELPCGARRVFLIDLEAFKAWWAKEGTRAICPRTYDAGALFDVCQRSVPRAFRAARAFFASNAAA